jgi:flagellar hook protein FlgE
MMRSLNSGVSGLQQFQSRIDVIGNNIANSNTLGFKSSRIDFADALSQTMQQSGTNGSGAIQVGGGVITSAIRGNFTNGMVSQTEGPTDLAIEGNGFFVVRNAADGSTFVTRAGDFHFDTQGYLVTTSGLRVQGYTDAALTTVGDIKIDPTADTFGFSSDGILNVTMGGVPSVGGQVLLQNFQNPGALNREGDNLFSYNAGAGPLATLGASNTGGLGKIMSSSLEMSNVDLTNEFSELITAQRGFQASARIITTSDEVLQEVVNLKR